MESLISTRMPYSKIRQMMDAATKIEESGTHLIHLEIGRPDFNTPDNIIQAAIDALKAGKVHYTANAGIIELRKVIAQKYLSRHRLAYDPATEGLVTNGVAEAIYLAIRSLLNPGDQVLIPNPTWINYEIVPLTGFIEPVSYSLNEGNGFAPDVDELERLVTPRTRMLVLVNPSNPTGKLLSLDQLHNLANFAKKHNLIVASDEVYEDIVYAPAEFNSIATLPDMQNRTVILNGFSKSYSMTGWRIGYAIGKREFINPMLRLHQYALTSVNSFAQWGAVEALEGTQEPLKMMLAEFTRRKDFIYDRISHIDGLSCSKPEGAFYLFINVKGLGLSGHEAADILLKEYGVVTVPGESFGSQGAGYLRISYASSMEDLIEAGNKFEQFAQTYKK